MNTTNTILIILLVILVGFGVWYFTAGRSTIAPQAPVEEGPDIEVDLDVPPAPESGATPGY